MCHIYFSLPPFFLSQTDHSLTDFLAIVCDLTYNFPIAITIFAQTPVAEGMVVFNWSCQLCHVHFSSPPFFLSQMDHSLTDFLGFTYNVPIAITIFAMWSLVCFYFLYFGSQLSSFLMLRWWLQGQCLWLLLPAVLLPWVLHVLIQKGGFFSTLTSAKISCMLCV